MVDPVRSIEEDIAVKKDKFRIFLWNKWFKFIQKLFFVEHVAIGVYHEGRIRDLWFRLLKGTFNDIMGDMFFFKRFDEVENIFKDSFEWCGIEEGDEHGGIMYFWFGINGF